MIPEVPPLLQERLEAQYGAELAREIEAGYVRKRTTFRVNPLKGDRDAVLREIADAGIATEPIAWYDDAFLLPDGNEEQLRALPCYDAGAIYLQSLSSMLPALVLAPKAGETVLDDHYYIQQTYQWLEQEQRYLFESLSTFSALKIWRPTANYIFIRCMGICRF